MFQKFQHRTEAMDFEVLQHQLEDLFLSAIFSATFLGSENVFWVEKLPALEAVKSLKKSYQKWHIRWPNYLEKMSGRKFFSAHPDVVFDLLHLSTNQINGLTNHKKRTKKSRDDLFQVRKRWINWTKNHQKSKSTATTPTFVFQTRQLCEFRWLTNRFDAAPWTASSWSFFPACHSSVDVIAKKYWKKLKGSTQNHVLLTHFDFICNFVGIDYWNVSCFIWFEVFRKWRVPRP